MFYLQDKLTQEKIQSEIERFVFEARQVTVGSARMELECFEMDKGWKDFYEEEKERLRDLKEFMGLNGNRVCRLDLKIFQSRELYRPKIEADLDGKIDEETFKKLIDLGWKINGRSMVYSFQQEEVYEKDDVSLFIYNTINLYDDYEWIITNDNLPADD